MEKEEEGSQRRQIERAQDLTHHLRKSCQLLLLLLLLLLHWH
jgi:hypothetical protein